jgi:Flp pilus assembly protein TadD
MNRTIRKLAASTAIVVMTMTGVIAPSEARRFGPVQATSPTDRQAAQLHEQAARALHDGHLDQAINLMEQAVALSPRDAGYRMLLADAYLKNGRFDSARATYGDVAALDPSNVRAELSIALMQIALGNPRAAIARLDDLDGRAPVADVALAYALAGAPDRAVALLEPAARAPEATPRVRQNLALAYALAGDWRRARAVAAQDVSPADLDARLAQWAGFARPGAAGVQVASMLGVTQTRDPGPPVRLALAPAAQDQAVALAEAAPVAPAPAPAPVQVAAAEAAPAEAPAFWVPTAQSYQPAEPAAEAPAPAPAPAPARHIAVAQAAVQVAPVPAPVSSEVHARYAAAARELVTPRAPFIRASVVSPTVTPLFQRARAEIRSGNAPIVVQLGAFSSEANAEHAWQQVSARYHLGNRRPLTTTIAFGGRTLHRVSVSGFASAVDAQRLCGQIRGQGGVCFVRGEAGDASIRWAARYANPRNRNV